MATSTISLRESIPVDHVIEFLKTHEYFRGVSDAILGEIVRFGAVTNYDTDATVHQLNDPLTSIDFILRGRVKAVRVDSRGDEHLFQTQWVHVELPPEEFPGYKGERIVCALCGEGINYRREVKLGAKTVCRACAGERYYEPV